MQQIDLPCGNAEHQPCIFHIDHTTRSRAPSEALALIFRPLTPVRFGANPNRFTSQAAARIRAIMAMSAPLTCSSGAAETGAEDCTVAWLFITNGSGDAFAQTE